MFTSETPILRSVAWSRRPNSPASAAERRSGSVTISTSGVPPRLKSTTLVSAPWMRPGAALVRQLRRVLLHVHAMDAHMEEDAAKLTHEGSSGRIHGAEASVVDFNRGGTPLVEIVTEPDIHSPQQRPRELGRGCSMSRADLAHLGADVNMDEGSLRVDGNVSIRPVGEAHLTEEIELKNMNSFRFLRRGL